jgi:hypothetical protein
MPRVVRGFSAPAQPTSIRTSLTTNFSLPHPLPSGMMDTRIGTAAWGAYMVRSTLLLAMALVLGCGGKNDPVFATDTPDVKPAAEVGGQTICTPACEGKQCGDDGCGGSCGQCTGWSEVCDDHQCVCRADCEGKFCGDNGCGGSCGSCCPGVICVDGHCPCMPVCNGRECGPDGCGGFCSNGEPVWHECADGSDWGCPDHFRCNLTQNRCVDCSANDICGDQECGYDGCGGSCGECSDFRECSWKGYCLCPGNSCTPGGSDPVSECTYGYNPPECESVLCKDGCCVWTPDWDPCDCTKDEQCIDCYDPETGVTYGCPGEVPEGAYPNLCTVDDCSYMKCLWLSEEGNVQCDDEDPCTTDRCDPLTGECEYVPTEGEDCPPREG